MPTVWIPALMRDLTGGMEKVTVSGATLGEVIEALDARFPGIRDRLCEGDGLRPGISVAVDGAITSRRLRQPVDEESEIHFVPAISGG
ncbi:MAG: hypothetical protein Kow0047_29980 [Anaerolineae bacterium]